MIFQMFSKKCHNFVYEFIHFVLLYLVYRNAEIFGPCLTQIDTHTQNACEHMWTSLYVGFTILLFVCLATTLHSLYSTWNNLTNHNKKCHWRHQVSIMWMFCCVSCCWIKESIVNSNVSAMLCIQGMSEYILGKNTRD